MDQETETIKKIIVEVPAGLHHKFKAACYEEGGTIKDFIITFINLFLDGGLNDKSKGKK